MTLEQLRIFVAVARRLNMTHAAKELCLTQSAVSASIAALESRHGVALFHRIGRGIALTATGIAFLDEAQDVLKCAARAAALLDDMTSLRSGSLHVVASQTVGNYWLPERLISFHEIRPNIALSVDIGNSDWVMNSVAKGAADVGFIETEVSTPGLNSHVIGHDELVLVGPAGHLPMSNSEISKLQWVIREAGSGTRAALVSFLWEKGLDLSDIRVVLELPSNEAIVTAIRSGRVVSLMSRMVAGALTGSVNVNILPSGQPRRAFSLIISTDRGLSDAAQAFVRRILESPI